MYCLVRADDTEHAAERLQATLYAYGLWNVDYAHLLKPIVGDLALGQQGIGSDFFALDIDGIKQGDGGFDLVGLLDFLVGYGESTYFFWVWQFFEW